MSGTEDIMQSSRRQECWFEMLYVTLKIGEKKITAEHTSTDRNRNGLLGRAPLCSPMTLAGHIRISEAQRGQWIKYLVVLTAKSRNRTAESVLSDEENEGNCCVAMEGLTVPDSS
jgi:hypothetical protein